MEEFKFYTTEEIEQAKLDFGQLKITCTQDGEKFFKAHKHPGNTINIIDRPYERFDAYENLLKIIRNDDQTKYDTIHKGTPFYFLAWTAFDMKNYEKAVFYMDAAISEDMRGAPIDWLKYPAGQFLILNYRGKQAANRITKHLNDKISVELSRFNVISRQVPISVEDFVENFVKKLVEKIKHHSIITAFYSFILEFEDRENELLLRSKWGGSIEPALIYLFKGGLIFESLLKYSYNNKNGPDCSTIGDIFKSKSFKNDFKIKKQKSAKTLEEIVGAIDNRNDVETAFQTTSKIRNTAGHNLVWDDVFDKPDNFKILYEQQVNAILYLIQKMFLTLS